MSDNVPAVVQTALDERSIDPRKVNLLLPTETYGSLIGKYDRLTVEVVRIDPNPKAGEVFQIEGRLAPARPAYQKIGSAIGLVEDPRHTGIIDRGSRHSRAKATAAMRKPNGDWLVLSEEKTCDVDAFEEEQRIKFDEKAERGNFNGKVTKWGETRGGKKFPEAFEPWESDEQRQRTIDMAVRKATLPYLKFRDERAMTGAYERLVRKFLAMKASYDPAELSRPFAIPRVTVDTDKMLEDPQMREVAMSRITGSVAGLFGPRENGGEGEDEVFSPPDQPGEDRTVLGIPPSEDDEEDDPFAPPAAGNPRDEIRETLEGYRERMSERQIEQLDAWLSENADAPMEEWEAFLGRVEEALGVTS